MTKYVRTAHKGDCFVCGMRQTLFLCDDCAVYVCRQCQQAHGKEHEP